MNVYCSVDLRNREEREIEDQCTFQPHVNTASPFVSERTLRRYSQQRLRTAPPPPDPSYDHSYPTSHHKDEPLSLSALNLLAPHSPGNHSTRSLSNKKQNGLTRQSSFNSRKSALMQMPIAGMYAKGKGYNQCVPPAAGIPIYAFDPFCPPNFALGKYGRPSLEGAVTVETEAPAKVQVVESATAVSSEPAKKVKGLVAPPIPTFLTNPVGAGAGGGGSEPSAPRKLVITKSTKPAQDDAPQGWQAVLAEMTVKRAAMKNKPIPEKKKEPEKKAPMKKIESGKKKKKKPGEFKDMMEELAYKFAVLRGDVQDEDKDDEEEAPAAPPTPASKGKFSPVPPPGQKKNPLKLAEPSSDSPSTPAVRKLGAKPDLAAMLAKAGKVPGASKAATPLPPDTPASSVAPTPVPVPPPPPAPPAKIAVPKAEKLPAAPPLPSAWPPVPYKAPPGAATPAAAEGPKPASSSSAPAPAVAAAPAPGKGTGTGSEQRVVVAGAGLQDLPEGYYIAATRDDLVEPYGILRKGDTTVEFIVKLTEMINRASEVEKAEGRQGQGGALSEQGGSAMADKNTVSATRKMTISDLPTPPSFAAAIQRMKKSHELRLAAQDMEKQLEYRSYPRTPKRSTSRSRTPGATPSSSSIASSSTPSKAAFFSDRYFENKQLSFRRAANMSEEDRLPLYRKMDRVANSSAYLVQDVDIGTASWMNSLRAPQPSQQPPPSPGTGPAAAAAAAQLDAGSACRNNPRDEYLQHLRSPTISQGPQLRCLDILDRRQSMRSDREALAQEAESEAEHAKRARKEVLRRKAVETAMATGSYRPPGRMHAHRKMIEKYSMRPEIGMDLAALTSQAYEHYTSLHHLSPQRSVESIDCTYDRNYANTYSMHSPYMHASHCSGPQLLMDDLLDQYDN